MATQSNLSRDGWVASRFHASNPRGGHHDRQNLSVVQSNSEKTRLAAALEMPALRLGIGQAFLPAGTGSVQEANFKRQEETMRHLALIAISLWMISPLGQAQEFEAPRRLGYVFLAPGRDSSGWKKTTVHAGAGGGLMFYKGLGLNVETGALFHPANTEARTTLTSFGGSYHFLSDQSSRKIVPFVVAGYSYAANSTMPNMHMVNFGGGVDYWFRENLGLRLEVRDHFSPKAYPNGTFFPSAPVHFLGYRIGVVWGR
ncbi:MAG: hypothetical protein HYX72_10020 [Acidobacteria bacterium]|nr:hypothetical protein [Acidobacteriota bacterium]